MMKTSSDGLVIMVGRSGPPMANPVTILARFCMHLDGSCTPYKDLSYPSSQTPYPPTNACTHLANSCTHHNLYPLIQTLHPPNQLARPFNNSDLQAGIWFGRVAPTLQCRSSCHYPCWISDCVVHLIVCTHVLFIDCDCTVVWWLANQRPRKCDMTFVLKPTYRVQDGSWLSH